MALKQRDKKVTRTSIGFAVGLHVILFIIFWNVGGKEIIQDFIMEVVDTKTPPPPPPPKKPPPKIKMKQPPKVTPKFTVKAPKIMPSVKPQFGTNLIPSMDMDVDDPDYTDLAMHYGATAFDDEQSVGFSIAAIDVMGRLGLDLTKEEHKDKKAVIYGTKRRTRGKVTWTVIRYNSGAWDDIINTGALKFIFNWINEYTQVKLDANSRTIDLEDTFTNWLKESRETVIKKSVIEKPAEEELLDELKRAAYILAKGDIDAKDRYCVIQWDAFDRYFKRRYDFGIKGRKIDEIMKDVEKEAFRLWRQEGVKTVLNRLQRNENEKRFLDGSESKELYMFARKTQLLTCPLIYMHGDQGISLLSGEGYELLQTYIKNGGFIWIDDAAYTQGQYTENRAFIRKITGIPEMDKVTKSVFKRLAQNDRDVPGFELIGNQPEPFHPWTYIKFNLPEQTPVSIRIFNKIGLPVRNYDLGELPSGSYADIRTALKWDCKNDKGEDVAPGIYFYQMTAGIYVKTKYFTVSKLRMLDKRHPVYSFFYRFDEVPMGIKPVNKPPYGNVTFGYYEGDRLAIVYNEGNQVYSGAMNTKDLAKKSATAKWVTNIFMFALTQEGGIATRP